MQTARVEQPVYHAARPWKLAASPARAMPCTLHVHAGSFGVRIMLLLWIHNDPGGVQMQVPASSGRHTLMCPHQTRTLQITMTANSIGSGIGPGPKRRGRAWIR